MVDVARAAIWSIVDWYHHPFTSCFSSSLCHMVSGYCYVTIKDTPETIYVLYSVSSCSIMVQHW